MKSEAVHVVGGGLVGALTAIFLAQRDFKVTLYERRPDMRRVDIPAGRSINLAVTSRGLKALDEVGLKADVLKLATPMKGRMLHDLDGKTSFVPYGQTTSEVINSVSRGELNKLLLAKADEYDNVDILFQQRCSDWDVENNQFIFTQEGTSKQKKVKAGVAIATDGAWSVVRKVMLERVMNFNYSQSFLAHGYKELVIPPTADGGFQMEEHALHIWPRKRYMLIALPNLDGSFTVTLFFPFEGEESFASLHTEKEVMAFFTRVFPDAVRMMPTLTEDYFHNPTGSMVTVKCDPWHVGGKVMMLGDASHAIVPFFGQGMNCGFEDCSALGELLDSGKYKDWESLFADLEKERKPSADAIGDMALENFVEMRDTVADPKFQLKKQIGFELEKRYPGKFIPRYAMVVFHPEISYAQARARSDVQDHILDQLSSGISSVDQVDWNLATRLIHPMKIVSNG